jgi:hypothetical protein
MGAACQRHPGLQCRWTVRPNRTVGSTLQPLNIVMPMQVGIPAFPKYTKDKGYGRPTSREKVARPWKVSTTSRHSENLFKESFIKHRHIRKQQYQPALKPDERDAGMAHCWLPGLARPLTDPLSP